MAEEMDHTPLEVTSVDGMPMIRCSCDGSDPRRVRWQSAYWLRDHWQGSQDEGVAAIQAVIAQQADEHHAPPADVREDDDGPECDLCGSTKCPDADLPGFSEPRDCVLAPVYAVLRYDRCDYGCGRDITTATVRRAVRTLRALVQSPVPSTPEEA